MTKIIFFFSLFVSLSLSQSFNLLYEKTYPTDIKKYKIDNLKDFAVDKDNNIYWLDSKTKLITIFDKNEEVITQIPNQNSAPITKFENPICFTLFNNGNLAVVDTKLKKIFILKITGELIHSFWNDDAEIGEIDSPIDIATDSDEFIYILDKGEEVIYKYNSTGILRGHIKLSSPLAFTLSNDNKVYALHKLDSKFVVSVFNSELVLLQTFNLPSLKNPSTIFANNFNETYILDQENCNVVLFNKDFVPIGNPVGIKSSKSGIAQFDTPTNIFVIPQKNNSDKLFIYDSDLVYMQSFNLNFSYPRKEQKANKLELKIEFAENFNDKTFIAQAFKNDTIYYITSERNIVAEVNSTELFKITPQSAEELKIKYSKPNDLMIYGNRIFVADMGEHCINIFKTDGSFIGSVGSKGSSLGQFYAPRSLVMDKVGNIYIADYDNNRISIISEQGVFIGLLSIPTEQVKYPMQLAINSKDELFILLENYNIIKYSINDKVITNLKMPEKLEKPKNMLIKTLPEDILAFYEKNSGIIYLMKDDKFYTQFISQGMNNYDLNNITSISYDYKNNNFYATDLSKKITKKYNMYFLPHEPQNLKISVNDKERTILKWKHNKNTIDSYKLYRKMLNDSTYTSFASTKDTSWIIEANQNFIYQYCIQAVGYGGMNSTLSNAVTDTFSYAMRLIDDNPKEAVVWLNKIKNLNESIISNIIISTLRNSVQKYKSEQNYLEAISYINEILKYSKTPDLLLEKASLFKLMMKFNDAINELEEARRTYVANYEIEIELIRLLMLNKDYSKVITNCKEVLFKFENNERILAILAEAYKLTNQNNEAVDVYKKLIAISKIQDHFINYSKILISEEKHDEALSVLMQIQNNEDVDPVVFALIGDINANKKLYAEASFQYEKAIAIEPENAQFHFLLGRAFLNSKKINQAIPSLTKAVTLDSTKSEYHFTLATAYETTSNYVKAAESYEKVIKYEPNNATALSNLGTIYLNQKKADFACKYLEMATKLIPDSDALAKKYNQAIEVRRKLNEKREPLEISSIIFSDIFPSLFNLYSSNSMGTISIYNTKNEAYEDVVVEIKSPNILKESTTITLPIILPNDSKEILVYLKLKDEIIKNSLQGIKNYEITINIKYNYGSKNEEKNLVQKHNIKVYSLNSISWLDKKNLLTFINSNDEKIRNFATKEIISVFSEHIADVKINKPIVQAMMIWEYLSSMNMNYVQDPNLAYATVSESNSIDYVQFAQQTLSKKVGDCDDFVVLLCTMLETIGVETAYIDIPGHVFMAFNTGILPDKLQELGLNENKYIIKNKKVWIPLETTMLSKNSFIESWDFAIDNYQKHINEGKRADLIEFSNSSKLYPPIQFPDNNLNNITKPDINKVKENLLSNINYYESIKKISLETEYLTILKKYPDNINTLQKLALFYVKENNLPKAIEFMEKAVLQDNKNAVTLINLGNIYYISKNYNKALLLYDKALLSSPNDVGILINKYKIYHMQQEFQKADEIYKKAFEINPELVKQYIKSKN